MDFFAHGGMLENENRFTHALQIEGITFDVRFWVSFELQILDGFLTLVIPYLKSGVRSEYTVQTFIKQKPSVICDLEVVISPTNARTNSERIDSNVSKTVIHQHYSVCSKPDHLIVLYCERCHHQYSIMWYYKVQGSALFESLEQRELSPSVFVLVFCRVQVTDLVSSYDFSYLSDLVALVSSIHTLLESILYSIVITTLDKEISVGEMIDNDNISNLVLLFDTDNSNLILELLDLFVAVYQESTPEQVGRLLFSFIQRSTFVDLGIHNSLVNLLNDATESVLPQVLRSIASIVLVDQEEQINFSNNEIWPSLESVLQNVCSICFHHAQFQDNIEIVRDTSFLLVALVKPCDGKHADVSQVVSINSTLTEVGSYYVDLYSDSENQSDIHVILDNLLLVFYAISVNDETIPYYYSTFVIVGIDLCCNVAHLRFICSYFDKLHFSSPLHRGVENSLESGSNFR